MHELILEKRRKSLGWIYQQVKISTGGNGMEYVNEVNINEAVIHVLDNSSDEPILNEYKLKLSEETYIFLLKHIEKVLKDEQLKYAVFEEESRTNKLAQNYLSGNSNLIDISKYLAIDLFNIMKINNDIPSCDLIVVSISTEYGPMLCVLKFDYAKSYMHYINFENNKMLIEIKPERSSLPISSQKIQKCAFIKTTRENNKFDLMFIDKQRKNKEEDYGANWFTKKFLDCSVVENERDLTKDFLNKSEYWTRVNLKENADAAEIVRRTIKEELKEKDNVDIPELAEKIFKENEAAKQSFISCVTQENEMEIIPVDKQYIEKKLKRRRLKIDTDIDLYINEEAYNDINKFQIKRHGDGSIDIVIKNVINYIEK